jgi:hypothetical protein
MIDFGVAYDKLASLDCAEDIADFLTHQGVKAVPNSGHSCAISQWMKDVTGGTIWTAYQKVMLGEDESFVDNLAAVYEKDAIESYETTSAMKIFISKFDRGDFPELVDEIQWAEYEKLEAEMEAEQYED